MSRDTWNVNKQRAAPDARLVRDALDLFMGEAVKYYVFYVLWFGDLSIGILNVEGERRLA